MIEIPSPNAFNINRLAGYTSLFPFSVKYSKFGEVSSLFLCPQRVAGVCDLLEADASEMIAVFDVEQASKLDAQTGLLLPLVELANEAEIEYRQIDISTIVMSTKGLSRLLSDFDHYDFHMFDVGQNWNEEEIIEQVITCREHDWCSRAPILSSLSHSNLFLYCHDDCYLTLESYNSLLLKRVFARTLRIYAGTVLAEKLQTLPALSEVASDIIDDFWHDNLDLTILRGLTKYNNDRLQIGVSKREFTFVKGGEYFTDFLIEYDIANQTWTVSN